MGRTLKYIYDGFKEIYDGLKKIWDEIKRDPIKTTAALLMVMASISSFTIFAINNLLHHEENMPPINGTMINPTMDSKSVNDKPKNLTVNGLPVISGATIQSAVDKANPGDKIKVAPGTHHENVKVDKSLTIVGAGASKTIVDGNKAGSVFRIGAGLTVVLSGMTIHNGQSPYGIDGGGIHIDGSTVTVTNCQISRNTGSSAGGIGIAHKAFLTVIDSEISNNSANAGGGGGIWTLDAGNTITVINSTISGNSAYAGGGIENLGTMTVTGSAISGNTAYAENQGGGGIFNLGTARVTDSEISKNSANGPGAGIYNYQGGTLKLSHDIIKENIASGGARSGGGIHNEGMITGQETCTFQENLPDDIAP